MCGAHVRCCSSAASLIKLSTLFWIQHFLVLVVLVPLGLQFTSYSAAAAAAYPTINKQSQWKSGNSGGDKSAVMAVQRASTSSVAS